MDCTVHGEPEESPEDSNVLKSWKILAQNHSLISFNENEEKSWRGSFYFIQGADSQFGLIERYVEKKPNPGWSQEIALSELAVKKVNAMRPKPAFFVVCGDLIDAMPGEDPKTYRKQVIDFKKVYKQLDPEIPLVCVCGNHDVGDNPTPDTINTYRSSFGDDYYSFWCRGMLFLILNSQYWCGGEGVVDLAEEHTRWLEGELAKAKVARARVVAFQHIPWFLKDVAEETNPPYFAVPKELRVPLLDKLVDSGVEAVFCGHYHRNAGGIYRGMPVVVTSAIGAQLGSDKSGVRVVKVMAKKLEHQYYPLEELPSEIHL